MRGADVAIDLTDRTSSQDDAERREYCSSQNTPMPHQIVAPTRASFSRAVAAAAICSWFAVSNFPAVYAADGAQAAAAAKESAKAFSDYAAKVAGSGERPDFSAPPVAEHFRRIFDEETLAALPPPEPDDLGWLTDWAESAESSFKALAMFGVQKNSDINAAIEHNLPSYESEIATAIAFIMHLSARLVSTAAIFVTPPHKQLTEEFRKTLLERAELGLVASHGLVDTVLSATQTMSNRLKPQNAALMMSAVRETVPAWAPYASAKKRDRILEQLEQARAANAGAGIDAAVDTVSSAIRSLKN
jgi:hypothetical protein